MESGDEAAGARRADLVEQMLVKFRDVFDRSGVIYSKCVAAGMATEYIFNRPGLLSTNGPCSTPCIFKRSSQGRISSCGSR